MSSTEIYSVGENHCEMIGGCQNAWRGAMYVWNDIAKRYFGLEHFPSMWGEHEQKLASRIWNAHNEHDLPEHEQVVLTSTMDRVLIKATDAHRLVDAFEQYGKEHPNSSLSEQAEIIKKALPELKDDQFIGFCQTSVADFHFAVQYDDEENEVYHDLSDGWDLFEQIDAIRSDS